MGSLFHIPGDCYEMPATTSEKLCRYFFRIGCDIETRNSRGETPLLHAANHLRGSAQWLRALIRCGADIAATDWKGRGALHLAWKVHDPKSFWDTYKRFGRNNIRAMIKEKFNVLLRAGCDPNSVDSYGKTPAHYARAGGLLRTWRSALKKTGIEYDGDSDSDDVKDSDEWNTEPEPNLFWDFSEMESDHDAGKTGLLKISTRARVTRTTTKSATLIMTIFTTLIATEGFPYQTTSIRLHHWGNYVSQRFTFITESH